MNRPEMDWRDIRVQHNRVMRELDSFAWAPRAYDGFRAFQWSCVTLVVCAFLFGMLVVGK